jgi:hypothetical protein
MKQPQVFQNRKVVSIHPHNGKLIVITVDSQDLYSWFVCDREYSILSDNTHDCGIDSEADAIAIAKNVIDNFIGDNDD